VSASATRRRLRAIAARGLKSAPVVVHPDEPVDGPALLAAVSKERLTGLALDAVAGGALELDPADADDLSVRHDDQLALDLRLERLLCTAAAELDAAGITYRALKGPLLAHTVYRDPALRSFGDIDILVRGADFDAAVDALRALEFHRRFVEPRPRFDARFSKGACLERADGLEVDLHRTLAPGPFGMLLGFTDLVGRAPQTFVLGDATITGLDRELAFVHACFHSALGDYPPRLVPLRDIAELLAAGFDARVVIDLVTDAQCEIVLQRALDALTSVLGVPVDGEIADWARTLEPSRFDRRALRTYESSDRSYAKQAAVSLWAMPSLRHRLAYASALAIPSRNYVRARERGYARRLGHSLALARGGRSR